MTKIFNEHTVVDGEVDVGADVQTEGGVDKLAITDDNQIQLLSGILTELKKVNLHLSFITDNFVTNQEVE